MRKHVVWMGLIALLWSWSTEVRAGSMETLGASSRGTAMGGAMVSIADGWEATYYNPSALALSRNSTSFQASMVSGELMQNQSNSLGGGYAFRFGLNRRYLRDRVGLGLIVGTSATGGGMSMDIGSILSGGGSSWNWAIYQDSMPVVFAVGLGLRITDWLSVGITANQKNGLLALNYPAILVDPLLKWIIAINGANPPNIRSMSFTAGADPASEVATGFNVSLRPSKYVSFGYMYKPEAWMRYKITLELPGGYTSVLSPTSWLLIDMKIPGQLETTMIGASGHVPIPWNDGTLTLSYCQETQNWDGYYPSNIQYSWDGTDMIGKTWFSGKNPKDPGLENITINRYGFEYEGDAKPLMFWKLKNLTGARFSVRGGYYHWPSPQKENPKHSWQIAMVDSDADVYSFGLGFGYDRKGHPSSAENPLTVPRLQIDFHFQQTTMQDNEYKFGPDAWGNTPLSHYWVKTSGNITNYGLQITWLQ